MSSRQASNFSQEKCQNSKVQLPALRRHASDRESLCLPFRPRIQMSRGKPNPLSKKLTDYLHDWRRGRHSLSKNLQEVLAHYLELHPEAAEAVRRYKPRCVDSE